MCTKPPPFKCRQYKITRLQKRRGRPPRPSKRMSPPLLRGEKNIYRTRQGPLPVPHPRRRLTAVTDDEQLEEVVVVPGHAGSWWLTPALCRFAPFAVRPPRLVKKKFQIYCRVSPAPQIRKKTTTADVQLLATHQPPPEPPACFSGFRGVSNPLPPLQTAGNSASFSGGAAPNCHPASLRRLLARRCRPIALMNTGLAPLEGPARFC